MKEKVQPKWTPRMRLLHSGCRNASPGWWPWNLWRMLVMMMIATTTVLQPVPMKAEPVQLWPRQETAQLQALLQMAQHRVHSSHPNSCLLLTLILMQQVLAAQGSLYWAYVPDPPLLQPVGWDVSSIPVYVNDTVLLGPPSSVHLRPQQAAISYKGYSDVYPICFAMKRTIPHCLSVSP
ncbi:endogenous retrovirus group K member 19 Env polyprotein isoform X2 [Mustela lutreola]|uniref:endogenous retrovirus group K member 19 Env polyprotein isoform X2 n=1 Tax=Mustela lutreola TaxID=9666 RepID=UPI00279770B5|nr:endogenous retrovirus group K member 19 Env polyprotein isoform X2 [Mustela lutreola]